MTKRLVVAYLAIVVFVLAILEIPLGFNFARHERGRVLSDLERDATVVAAFAEDTLEGKQSTASLQATLDRYATATGERLIVVDRAGVAVADSQHGAEPENFASRPEIRSALAGTFRTGSRYSRTVGDELLYAAVPAGAGGTIEGAARVTFPARSLNARIRRNWLILAALGVVLVGAASLVGWALARTMTKPVDALEASASRLAAGALEARAPSDAGPPELRALARTFNDMAARIEDLVTAQRSFVADASHELRTPLTALRLRLENLEGDVGEDGAADLAGAVREARRMGRIVEGLLALARAESAAPERADVDVSAILRDRVDLWMPLAEQSDVKLRAEEMNGLHAAAVPGHLEQIADNLIANAVAASPPGASVDVTASRVADRVEIHIVDEGPGMSDEDRARAFDRFWRKEPGKGGGSGLGLAIARQLAVISGGDIELIKAATGGIDAIVRIPAARS
ncbi:MAG: ATP-binding protein [Actinomycetota bacterium]